MTNATNYTVVYFTTGPATITPANETFDTLGAAKAARAAFFANNADAYAAEIVEVA